MTWEELLAALAKTPEGQKLVDAAKEIMAGKDTEIKTKGKEVTTAKTAQKKAETELKTATERLTTVLETFEIDGEAEDLEEAIEAAKAKLQAAKDGAAAAPEVAQLQKDLSKMQREFKKLQTTNTENEKLLGEERSKRHAGMKSQALLAALTENKAIKPDKLVKLLQDNVKIGDDDSLTFVGEDGVEIDVKEGVKTWLTGNPEFVINNQNPGGGSGGGAAGDDKGGFAKAILDSGKTSERMQQAESHYFGASNK